MGDTTLKYTQRKTIAILASHSITYLANILLNTPIQLLIKVDI